MFTPNGLGLIWFASRKCAKDNDTHPETWTNENIKTMREQLKSMGLLMIGLEKYILIQVL